MNKPLNLKLALVLAVLCLAISIGSALVYRFPTLTDDGKISFAVTYGITLVVAYYLFSFLLAGNVLARKLIVLLSLGGVAMHLLSLAQRPSMSIHTGLGLLVDSLAMVLVVLLLSSPVSQWLSAINKG